MILLSQQDQRWGKVTLGNSMFNIARWGCLLTCLSMLTDYYQSVFNAPFKAPDQLAKELSFTPEGLFVWTSLPLHTSFKLEKRLYNRDDGEILNSIKDKYRSVALNINYGAHWVLAIGKIPFTNIFITADPWDGKKKLSTAYKNIAGSAHFILNK